MWSVVDVLLFFYHVKHSLLFYESGGCVFVFKGKSDVFFVIYKRQKESVNVNAAESILL